MGRLTLFTSGFTVLDVLHDVKYADFSFARGLWCTGSMPWPEDWSASFRMLQRMGVVELIMNKHGHCCEHNDPMLNGYSARMGTQILVLVLPTRRGCTSHNWLCLCCLLAAQVAGKYVE